MLTLFFAVSLVNFVAQYKAPKDASSNSYQAQACTTITFDNRTYCSKYIDITTVTDLTNLSSSVAGDVRCETCSNYYYRKVNLQNDIDCTGYVIPPIGMRAETRDRNNFYYVTETFIGEFDGNGHTLYNVNIKRPKDVYMDGEIYKTLTAEEQTSKLMSYNIYYLGGLTHAINNTSPSIGLFGVLGDDTKIHRVRLKNISINSAIPYENVADKSVYGGIAGGVISKYGNQFTGITIINECAVEGLTINGDFRNSHIGGIVGTHITGRCKLTVSNCYFSGFTNNATTNNLTISNSIGPCSSGDYVKIYVYDCVAKDSSLTMCSLTSSNYTETADNHYILKNDLYNNTESRYNLHWSSESGYWYEEPEYWYNTQGSEPSIWYHVDNGSYNGGYPYLRCFMGWKRIKFRSFGNGDVSEYDLFYGSTPIGALNNPTIIVDDTTVKATPDTGYVFTGWDREENKNYLDRNGNIVFYDLVYTAYFSRAVRILTFANATGLEAGDNPISPYSTEGVVDSAGISFNVVYDTSITYDVTETDNNECALTYTFNFITEVESYPELPLYHYEEQTVKVTYTIPAKYNLKDAKNLQSVIANTTIAPEVEAIILSFAEATGVEEGDNVYPNDNPDYNIKHYMSRGTEITILAEYKDEKLVIKYTFRNAKNSLKTVTYTADEKYKCNNANSFHITSSLELAPSLSVKTYNVKFKVSENATLTNNTLGITYSSDAYVTVKHGAVLEHEQTASVLTFTGLDQHDRDFSYTYEPNSYWQLVTFDVWVADDYADATALGNIKNNVTIEPILTRLCIVQMGEIDAGIGTRTVTGDGYETENDGMFAVKVGTEVKFTFSVSNAMFTYIYTFSSGQVVTYTITNDNYTMYSTLIQGVRIWHTELGESKRLVSYNIEEMQEGIPYMIFPTFELKQYGGNVA